MRLPILLEIRGNQLYFGTRNGGLPKEPIAQAAFANTAGIPGSKFLLTATVFDPPRNVPLFGAICSLSELTERKNPSCAGQYPEIIQFEEPFASSDRARSMYWVAVPDRDKCQSVSCRAFPNFYFPEKNGATVAPVHTVCVLPSSR